MCPITRGVISDDSIQQQPAAWLGPGPAHRPRCRCWYGQNNGDGRTLRAAPFRRRPTCNTRHTAGTAHAAVRARRPSSAQTRAHGPKRMAGASSFRSGGHHVHSQVRCRTESPYPSSPCSSPRTRPVPGGPRRCFRPEVAQRRRCGNAPLGIGRGTHFNHRRLSQSTRAALRGPRGPLPFQSAGVRGTETADGPGHPARCLARPVH